MKYLIEKGNHYANWTWNRLCPFTSNKIEGEVKFDISCLTEASPSGWNKLTGITSLKIHNNSGRLVWRTDGKKILIAGYVYNKGVRKEVNITSLLVDEYYKFSIEYLANTWTFKINGKLVRMNGNLSFIKLRAYPYFGGKATSPCDIKVEV